MDKKLKLASDELRFRAEAFLNSGFVSSNLSGFKSEAFELVNELLSNQISLLSQNQELHSSKIELLKECDNYRDLLSNQNPELNQLLQVIVDVSERVRNNLSRDLHDGLGPLLSTIKLYFQMLNTATDPDKRKMLEENVGINIERALQTTRELARGLSSQFLSAYGYIAAIRDFVTQINDSLQIRINFTANSNNRFNYLHEVSLYRITNELVRNTLTHSQATEVKIEFFYDSLMKVVTLLYSDNGIGFDLQAVQKNNKGLGLANILERVHLLKGTVKIETKQGSGMMVRLQFSVDENLGVNKDVYNLLLGNS